MCAEARAQADGMKMRAFLLWGTNESKPPEGRAYNPADIDIRQKLKDLPLKWTNWFEVNRKDVALAQGANKEVHLSDKCQMTLKGLGGQDVEVSLIGKGSKVITQKQALPKGKILVLGGNAPNATAWLVVLKRIE